MGSQIKLLLPRWLFGLLLFSILHVFVGLNAVNRVDPPTGRFSLKVYGQDQGLANPVVWCIAQDRRGFMWFGTEDGLYRYDGARFAGWTLKDGLPAALIEHICFDAKGKLWLGTYSGLACKDASSINIFGAEQGLPQARIRGLYADPSSRVWVITDNGPYWQISENTFQAVPDWPGGMPIALTGAQGSSDVWISFSNMGVYGVYRWSVGGWAQIPFTVPVTEPIEQLAVAPDGTVWLRSKHNLWSKKPDSPTFSRLSLLLPPVNETPLLYIDPEGKLWIPTVRGITTVLAGKSEELSEKQGLFPQMIHCLFVDREGSLWIGGNNLHRVLGGGLFRHWHSVHGLPSDVVWVSLRDSLGRLLVGTDAGLAVASPTGFNVVPGSENFQVRSAVLGPDAAIYAVGQSEMLRWHPSWPQAEKFGSESGFCPEGRVFRLLFSPKGQLWFATESTGLIQADFEKGQPCFRQIPVPGGDSRERFTDIWFDDQQRLWAAGARGLAVNDNGQWFRFTRQDGLKLNQTAFIRPRAKGGMLLGYFAAPGLSLVSFDAGRFKVRRHYDDVFPPEVVYFFGEDAVGGLWLGTGQGVYLQLADGRVEHFTRHDGLASENMSNMSLFSEEDGVVWFGTTGGLHRFDARQYKGYSEPPQTSILEVSFGSRKISGELLTEQVIAAKDNTVECVFAAPSSFREGAVQYQARLAGYENEWRSSPNRQERYPRLPPGRYIFEARARIGSGEYGPSASWAFEVLPIWYQSLWFKLLLTIMVVLVVMVVISWRIGALRRRNQTLQKMVSARTSELNRANEQLHAQSITDPLTGLKNRRYLSACMSEDVALTKRMYRSVQQGQKDRLQVNIDLIFLMVDIDYFKSVNDRYGHAAGDLVLQQVAEIIRQCTRDTDTVVRWGGEEFLIVARNAARLDSHLLAERIRAGIESHVFDLGNGQTIRKTCSVGFCFYPFHRENPDLLNWEKIVDLADQCLYTAKRSGRNAWVGLYMGLNGDKELIVQEIDHQLEKLIMEGHVEVRTSLSNGASLVWKTVEQ